MLVDLVSIAQKGDWPELRKTLYKHWITHCPKLYQLSHEQPWDSSQINEKPIVDNLFVPLVATFFGDSQNSAGTLEELTKLTGIDPSKIGGQICGHVFKNGELTYTCVDCATDGTCVMCLKCFEASIHKTHKYRMHSSTGSGYCDCGDADAWLQGYACSHHDKTGDGDATLPAELRERCREIVEICLYYCISLIVHQEDQRLPSFLEELKEEMTKDVTTANQYLTVLYNDETHTYESVIKVLEMYIHCSKDQAMLVATIVDREGRSAVKIGTKTECTKAKDDVQRKTRDSTHARRGLERHPPLSVKVMDTVLFAHQSFAIALLNWLNSQMDVFPPLREIVGDVMLKTKLPPIIAKSSKKEQPVANLGIFERHAEGGELADLEMMDVDEEVPAVPNPSPISYNQTDLTMLETILLQDTDMWKCGRSILHQMLMRTVFMNYEQKVQLAKAFMQHYDHIYQDFIDDDHDMDVSVVGLSVQFLTVPALARRLVAEDDALSIICKTIIKQTTKYIKTDEKVPRFDFTGRSFPNELRRALQITRDMAYLLNAVPVESEWNPDLERNFLNGFSVFLDFIKYLQGMDEVKRQATEHQVWESEWETAFNILLRLKDAISMMIGWAETNKNVHNKMLLMCLEEMEKHPVNYATDESGSQTVIVPVDGVEVSVMNFDVLRGATSIHQPIVRIIAGLFAHSKMVDFFFLREPENDVERAVKERVTREISHIYEMSMRVLCLCAQSNAQLWRRNGFSLINQIHNYFSPLCRNEMFDRDILTIQVGAALTDTTRFIIHALHRYRIQGWANTNFDGSPPAGGSPTRYDATEELSRVAVTLAEEFLHMLILICSERYIYGVGKVEAIENNRRDVIHILCTGSHTFSHIQQKMSHDINTKRISLHDVVNAVADFRKPNSTSAGQFHCKEEFLSYYTPFFMHYSKSDQSAAEQYQNRIRAKLDKSLKACPPPVLPEFEPFFAHIADILNSPVLLRILKSVINRTAKRSRYSSDRVFHKALYLIGMGLNEEERRPETFNFVEVADSIGLMETMEAIVGKPESSICPLLLEYLIEKYKKLRSTRAGHASEDAMNEPDQAPVETIEEMKARRAAKAAEMRKKAMAKMTNMQTKFMKQIEDEEEKTKKEHPTSTAAEEKKTESVPIDYGKSEFDEDIVRQIGQEFPVCIGANKWRSEIVTPRKLTCILCQEDEQVHPSNGKPMVCAAFIQQSQLFTHKNKNGELLNSFGISMSTRDLLTAPATLQYGVDVSTCSHSMHFECYKSLSEQNRTRDSLRARQIGQHNHKMVDSDSGEYQCPLCKRLSNSAIPILPAYQLTSMQGFSTVSGADKEDFDSWVSRVKRGLDMPCSSESVRKKGHSRKRSHSERSLLDLEKQSTPHFEKSKEDDSAASGAFCQALADSGFGTMSNSVPNQAEAVINGADDAEFYHELAAMLCLDQSPTTSPTQTPETTPVSGSTPRSVESPSTTGGKPGLSGQISHALSALIRPFPALININKTCGSGLEQYEDSIKELGKNMIKFRKRGNETKTKFMEKHLKGYMIATVTWQSAAHVSRAITAYLRYDGKPLFGALNTRHRDCLSAMARLCASLSHNLQFLLHAVSDMLRVLCCEPPKQKLTPTPGSPQGGTSSSQPVQTQSNINFLMQLFGPAGPRKNANLNILQVDILSLAISLMMSIGWTWHNGLQSMSSSGSQKARQLTPDGSVDEAHVLRLSLLASYFQIVATHDENDGDDVNMEEEEPSTVDPSLLQLVQKLYNLARPEDPPLKRVEQLYRKMEEGAQNLLSPIALLYHFITLVDPPEALKDPSINSSEALFRYLNLPSKIEEQLSGGLVENLFTMWSHAIPKDANLRKELVIQPVRPNLLIGLPETYSQLITQVSNFRCPSIPIEESTSNVPTICLVCGQVLCSQAYCCQKIVNKQPYGACRYHMSQCSGSVGVFLRVRDCNLVLMTTRKRGCFRPAPYVDEFGEVDQGFRRGNPLHLNPELYQKLKQLWLQQGITEEVVNYNEIDYRNIQYDWAHF